MNTIQIAVSGALFSLIWLVQLLIYPSFRFFDKSSSECMLHHQNRITWVVAPLMIIELVVTALQMNYFLLGIVITIWLSTAFIQVPLHKKLISSREEIDQLIRTNWIRTTLWTIKLFIVLSTSIHSL